MSSRESCTNGGSTELSGAETASNYPVQLLAVHVLAGFVRSMGGQVFAKSTEDADRRSGR